MQLVIILDLNTYLMRIVIDCIVLTLNTNFNTMDHMLNEQASICHKSQDMSEKAF